MSLYPDWFDDETIMIDLGDGETPEGYSYNYDYEKRKVQVTMTGKTKRCNEHNSYLYWVFKNILTERYAYAAYSSDFGTEIEDILAQDYDRAVTESEISRTIREALATDERTIDVRDFYYQWLGDALEVRFVLESIYNTDTLNIRRRVDNNDL